MPKYNITLSLDTIGTLDEGGMLEEIMHEQVSRIANMRTLDDKVYEARRLVAVANLLDTINYSNRKTARAHECQHCGVTVPEGEHCGTSDYLCPDCYGATVFSLDEEERNRQGYGAESC